MLSLGRALKPSQVRHQQRAFEEAALTLDPTFGFPVQQEDEQLNSDAASSTQLSRQTSAVVELQSPPVANPETKIKSVHDNYTFKTTPYGFTNRNSTFSMTSSQPPSEGGSFQRRASGARKLVQNFSRRFDKREPSQPKPLDIASLPQTADVRGVNGTSGSYQENVPPQAQAHAGQQEPYTSPTTQQTAPHQQQHPGAPPPINTNQPLHHSHSSRDSTESGLSSPPLLRPPQPHRLQSQLFAATSDFKLPELPWLCGTWYITHSTIPMWRDKRNVRVTYTRLEHDKLDEVLTFQQLPGTESAADVGNAGNMTGSEAAAAAAAQDPSIPQSPPRSSAGGSPTSPSGKRRSLNLRSWRDVKGYATDSSGMKSDLADLGDMAATRGKASAAQLQQSARDYQAGTSNIGVKSAGAGDGSDRYKGAPGELKQVRGTDTVCKDGSYLWKGKGFGMLKSGTWEVLGWGGGGRKKNADFADASGDVTHDQWIITYFGRTMFSAPGFSICARKKEGLSEKKIRQLVEGLKHVDGQLKSEGRRGGSGDGVGDFGKMVEGLYEVVRDEY